MTELHLLVEGALDKDWVSTLLSRAFGEQSFSIKVTSCNGKRAALAKLLESNEEAARKDVCTIALLDADEPSVADARESVSKLMYKLGGDGQHLISKVFFAVPEYEAWLFADIETAKRCLNHKTAALERLQFADEIPSPRQLALSAFGGREQLRAVGSFIMSQMDIDVAISRSSSLRDFLSGIGKIIGDYRYDRVSDAFPMLGPRLLASLIRETNPSSDVMYKTLNGDEFTAEDLAQAILKGTKLGREYASDLLRIARDQLGREARRKTD